MLNSKRIMTGLFISLTFVIISGYGGMCGDSSNDARNSRADKKGAHLNDSNRDENEDANFEDIRAANEDTKEPRENIHHIWHKGNLRISAQEIIARHEDNNKSNETRVYWDSKKDYCQAIRNRHEYGSVAPVDETSRQGAIKEGERVHHCPTCHCNTRRIQDTGGQPKIPSMPPVNGVKGDGNDRPGE